ncbi:hypothetical protein [Labrys sp. 22185]|uniref:hypothetical protein n=1 Tax=Labrys sp. 22185 TaxID=3453888 RepID=UPI003F87FC84
MTNVAVTSTPNPIPLGVYVRGATDDELKRGHDAVLAFFEQHNCTAEQVATGAFAWEGYLVGEDIDVTDDDERFAQLWAEAPIVAAKAICEGWENPAPRAALGLGYSKAALADIVDGDHEGELLPPPDLIPAPDGDAYVQPVQPGDDAGRASVVGAGHS